MDRTDADAYRRLVTKAAELYADATRLYEDKQYVQIHGFGEINLTLRRGEFLMKLAELSHG